MKKIIENSPEKRDEPPIASRKIVFNLHWLRAYSLEVLLEQ